MKVRATHLLLEDFLSSETGTVRVRVRVRVRSKVRVGVRV